MLAIRKLSPPTFLPRAAWALLIFLAGCAPPGPRGLLEGDRLIQEGKYRQAVQTLESVRKEMERDPRFWNCLGMAYQGAGDVRTAVEAYRYALSLDRSNQVFVAHYNLGSVYLEQGDAAAAANELRSFCMLSNSVPALLKLGQAELRTRQWDAADRTFGYALRLQPGDPAALNGLGLVSAQRNRTVNAAKFFQEALKNDPKFAPALLNLAVVYHQQPGQKAYAAQKYREYLALDPRPEQYDTAKAALQRLELELAPAPRPLPTNVVVVPPVKTNVAVPPVTQIITTPPPAAVTPRPVVPHATTESRPPAHPATNVSVSPAATKPVRAAPPTVAAPAAVPKTEVVIVRTKPPPAELPATSPPPVVTLVTLPAEQPVKPARDVSVTPTPPPSISPAASLSTNLWVVKATPAKPEKKNFLQSLNPFRSKSKPPPATTKPAAVVPASAGAEPTAPAVPVVAPLVTNLRVIETPARPTGPRYNYLSPARPLSGDRKAAEVFFQQGLKAQQEGQIEEAMIAYRTALEKDPAYYEAYYNVGLLAFQVSDWKAALGANERALAITPESVNARLNLGLTLDRANYPQDAVAELEKVVQAKPEEVRAHLALGNLYAQKLGQTAQAREHYLKVLELEPAHAQSSAIRYWLAANP